MQKLTNNDNCNTFSHKFKKMNVKYENVMIYGRNGKSSCDERKKNSVPCSKLKGIGYHAVEKGFFFYFLQKVLLLLALINCSQNYLITVFSSFSKLLPYNGQEKEVI